MNDITPTEAMATIRRVADIFAPPECPRCLDFGELVAVGHGRTIRLDQWNGDSGDVVDCECKGEPMSTNSGYVSISTETVERLISIVRDYAEHTEDEHGYSFPVGIAKQIIEELQVALKGGNWWVGSGDRPRRRAAGGD